MPSKIRGVKPETWTDSKFVRASPLARLLFLGMWNFCCDNGHVDDDEVQLKIRILPLDNCDISELLGELIAIGLVVRLPEMGALKVPNLPRHQKIDLRFLTLCDHCEHDGQSRFSGSDRKGRSTGKQGADGQEKATTQRAPSGHPTSARRAPDVCTAVAQGDGDGDGDGELKNSSPRGDGAQRKLDAEFGGWWELYPRKVGKGQAVKAFRAARKKVDLATLSESVQAFAASVTGTDAKFIPHASTWLNGERWADAEPEGELRLDGYTRDEWVMADPMNMQSWRERWAERFGDRG